MLIRNYRIFSLFGIPIEINPTWLFTLAFFVYILGGELYPDALEDEPAWFLWALAFVSGLLFFASIIVHELAHSLVAQRYGIPVRAITLFMLGGVSQITKEAKRPLVEFVTAIVGPLTSFLLAAIFVGLALTPGIHGGRIGIMFEFLFVMNLSLGVVNMAPGFPLDGGRVLRGIVWWITGNAVRATRIAARVGQVIAFVMILYGLMQFFRGAGFNGLWIAFIGWFLLSASRESYAQMVISEGLRGLRVGDVMSRDFPVVDAHSNLQTFAEENLTRTGRRFWVVTLNGQPEGIITPNEMSAVTRNRWPYTTVADVMRPLDATHTVNPNTPVTEALEVMASQDLNQLPVMNEHGLAGLISRSHILQLIQTRAELHL